MLLVSMIRKVQAALVCGLLFVVSVCCAKTPDAEILVLDQHFYASYGTFGSRKRVEGRLFAPPDPWLCREALGEANYTTSGLSYDPNALLLTKRGQCSFERKALAARRLGAAGVVIYNNLESRYGTNTTSLAVQYPRPRTDYECSNGGRAHIAPDDMFALDPPNYSAALHDAFLTLSSPHGVCHLPEPARCASQRCLVTAKDVESGMFTACCAWDIWVGMSHDVTLHQNTDDIVAVFITMRQSQVFLDLPEGTPIVISARPYPKYNASSFLLWLMASFTTWFASWLSASDYRRAHYKLTHPQEDEEEQEEEVEIPQQHQARPPQEVAQPPPTPHEITPTISSPPQGRGESSMESAGEPTQESPQTAGASMEEGDVEMPEQRQSPPTQDTTSSPSQEQGGPSVESAGEPTNENLQTPVGESAQDNPPESDSPPVEAPPVSEAAPPRQTTQQRQQRHTARRRNGYYPMELNIWHAVIFVGVASVLLLLLFFFEFYTVVTVLYGLGCSAGLAQLIFRPLLELPSRFLCASKDVSSTLDLASVSIGYGVGAIWLYVWFVSDNPSQNTFYWIFQDLMGACVSILFLGLLRLYSIKVATVLLLAVFVYDVFFVWISPYLFDGDSVMVTVATSGGPGELSQDECEKYPFERECRKGQPLPMLLTLPKINDFRGGSHLLGLGDIVLPGLLMSFAARLDASKRLVGCHTRMQVEIPPKWGGYLVWLTVAYTLGLLIAKLAVVWMQRGQPALLYLVPACLGAMVIVGRREWGDLWKGPQVMRWADRLVLFCDNHRFVRRSNIDDDDVTAAESYMDESIHELDEEDMQEEQQTSRRS